MFLKAFNVIVSTYRFGEEDASDEILYLLENFGDAQAACEITEIRGILLVQTALDPFDVIRKLKTLASSEPWEIRHILRVIPISMVVSSEIREIAQGIKNIRHEMLEGDRFRVTVEKRHSILETKEVINAVASTIHNRVDLENPDWIVMVQIVGSQTGITILRPDQIFSSVIEKRG